MLTTIFLIAAAILVGTLIRGRPRTLWPRIVVVLAGILMLAVLVAWAIEFMLARP